MIQRATATMLILTLLSGCTARNKADWARVQAVEPPTEMEVQLHDDGTPFDDRKFKGRFQSGTDNSVTLSLKDSGTDTFHRKDIRKVLTRTPAWSTSSRDANSASPTWAATSWTSCWPRSDGFPAAWSGGFLTAE